MFVSNLLCVFLVLIVYSAANSDLPPEHIKKVNSLIDDVRIGEDIYYYSMKRTTDKSYKDDRLKVEVNKHYSPQLAKKILAIQDFSDGNSVMMDNEHIRPYLYIGFCIGIMLNNFIQEKASSFNLSWNRLMHISERLEEPYQTCMRATLRGIKKVFSDLYEKRDYDNNTSIAKFRFDVMKVLLEVQNKMMMKCTDEKIAEIMIKNPDSYFPSAHRLVKVLGPVPVHDEL